MSKQSPDPKPSNLGEAFVLRTLSPSTADQPTWFPELRRFASWRRPGPKARSAGRKVNAGGLLVVLNRRRRTTVSTRVGNKVQYQAIKSMDMVREIDIDR